MYRLLYIYIYIIICIRKRAWNTQGIIDLFSKKSRSRVKLYSASKIRRVKICSQIETVCFNNLGNLGQPTTFQKSFANLQSITKFFRSLLILGLGYSTPFFSYTQCILHLKKMGSLPYFYKKNEVILNCFLCCQLFLYI